MALDPVGVDDRKVMYQEVATLLDDLKDPFSPLDQAPQSTQADPDHTEGGPFLDHEIPPIVFVLSDDKRVLFERLPQDRQVAQAPGCLDGIGNVMSKRTKADHKGLGDVFIGVKLHDVACSRWRSASALTRSTA